MVSRTSYYITLLFIINHHPLIFPLLQATSYNCYNLISNYYGYSTSTLTRSVSDVPSIKYCSWQCSLCRCSLQVRWEFIVYLYPKNCVPYVWFYSFICQIFIVTPTRHPKTWIRNPYYVFVFCSALTIYNYIIFTYKGECRLYVLLICIMNYAVMHVPYAYKYCTWK